MMIMQRQGRGFGLWASDISPIAIGGLSWASMTERGACVCSGPTEPAVCALGLDAYLVSYSSFIYSIPIRVLYHALAH